MNADLVHALLAWYRAVARDLPWRSDPTPYKVLLSELMLQQTRVETVLPYFARFLERWPTLEDLAAASEDDVVTAWAGLGYYRRARFLHRCAVAATATGVGLPSDVTSLAALPGIGPYTAGAVASIAFRQRVPLVDGNVERVLSRLHAFDGDPRSTGGKRALWAHASALHDALPDDEHPGDLNQALMELGATVCAPRGPRCGGCPLAVACRGQARAEDYPRKAPKKAPVPIRGAAGLLWVDGLPVLGRRAGRGLLGGLWEPVRVDIADPGSAAGALTDGFRAIGLAVDVGPAVGQVVHVFTHRILTATVHPVVYRAGLPAPGGPYDAVAAVEPSTVGLSTLARKVLELGRDRQDSLPLAADAE